MNDSDHDLFTELYIAQEQRLYGFVFSLRYALMPDLSQESSAHAIDRKWTQACRMPN